MTAAFCMQPFSQLYALVLVTRMMSAVAVVESVVDEDGMKRKSCEGSCNGSLLVRLFRKVGHIAAADRYGYSRNGSGIKRRSPSTRFLARRITSANVGGDFPLSKIKSHARRAKSSAERRQASWPSVSANTGFSESNSNNLRRSMLMFRRSFC